MTNRYFACTLVLACFMMTGCSITQTIDPVKPVQVSRLCMLENPRVFMDEFQPEMSRQIEARGIPTKLHSGERPGECSHHLEYTANWAWDMAMYLTYAELRVYDARGLAGQAIYDARNGGGRPDKFGRTAEKLRPLVDQLFGAVTVGSVVPTASRTTNDSPAALSREARLRELQKLKEQGLITDEELADRRRVILNDI